MALSTRQLRIGLVAAVGVLSAGLWWGSKLFNDDHIATPPEPVEPTPVVDDTPSEPAVALPPSITEATIVLPELDASLSNEALLALGDAALMKDHLALPLEGSALHYYATVLLRDPGHVEAGEAFESVMARVFDEAEAALAADRVADAAALLPKLSRFSSEPERLARFRQRLEDKQRIAALLVEAEKARSDGRLVGASGATGLLMMARDIDADNDEVNTALRTLRVELVADAIEMAREQRFGDALAMLDEAQQLPDGDGQAVLDARIRIGQFLDHHVTTLEQQGIAALVAGDSNLATGLAEQLSSLGASDAAVRLEAAIENFRVYGPFHPGQKFYDEANDRVGPQMVVLPAGSFLMGSDADEASPHEQPVHEVRFDRGFALAATETTVRQFTQFVNATGYRTDAELQGHTQVFDETSGRTSRRSRIDWRHDLYGQRADPDLPVIHVSFSDAQAYTAWLRETLDKPYRLPTEAEFEYALRGGSTTTYWWGSGSPDTVVENVTGSGDRSGRRRSWSKAFKGYDDGFWGAAPVAQFAANPFGLFDMGGNVSEWVIDCWHDTYLRAPRDGRAWVNPGCERRVIRGGSWSSPPVMVRSAWRSSGPQDYRDVRVGFRVARDIHAN